MNTLFVDNRIMKNISLLIDPIELNDPGLCLASVAPYVAPVGRMASAEGISSITRPWGRRPLQIRSVSDEVNR